MNKRRFNKAMTVIFIVLAVAFTVATVWCIKTHHPWYITALAAVVSAYYAQLSHSLINKTE